MMHRTVRFARGQAEHLASLTSRVVDGIGPHSSCTPPNMTRCCGPSQAINTKRRNLSTTSSFWSSDDSSSSSSHTSSSSSSSPSQTTRASFHTTPLGQQGSTLLDGLDVYSVPSEEDGHPLAVYGINSEDPVKVTDDPSIKPILLLHGRTWSAVPVYHLLGGPKNAAKGEESRSLLEAFVDYGLQPYAMDFRGFGGTHHDESGFVEPYRCVHDAESVLKWISHRHGIDTSKEKGIEKPALLGWSQGALVAQLAAQVAEPQLCKLILYGSIYDPLVRYPREPLYTLNKPNRTIIENTFEGAVEDFTIEGTISSKVARQFADAALTSDPIKAVWRSLYQFNNIDPARVKCPTLVIAGDQDPYSSLHVQGELFSKLGRGYDRTWSILAEADHAAHLLEGRHRLISLVSSFVMNGKRAEFAHRF